MTRGAPRIRHVGVAGAAGMHASRHNKGVILKRRLCVNPRGAVRTLRRVRYFTAACLVVANVGSAQSQAQRQLSDSGAFILRLGRDTLKVERFSLRNGELRTESIRRAAGVEFQRVDAILNPDGSVARATVRAYAWPVLPDARPTLSSEVYTKGDSTIIEAGFAPNARRWAFPGRGHVFNLGINPYIFSWFVTSAAYAPQRTGDSVLAQHMAGSLGMRPFTIRRVAPDWVTARSSFMGMMRIRVDEQGRVLELDGIGSSLNFHGERVGWVDLDSVGRAVEQMIRMSGGVAAMSPRDSVKAAVAGAHLTIDYGRPSKRDRVVFGGIVPWNRVWRTGANLATHFTTDRPLEFGDVVIPPDRYTLYTLPTENGWSLIVSRKVGQWGTEYEEAYDLARVSMKVRPLAQPLETLTLTIEPTANGGVLRLRWDNFDASAAFRVR